MGANSLRTVRHNQFWNSKSGNRLRRHAVKAIARKKADLFLLSEFGEQCVDPLLDHLTGVL